MSLLHDVVLALDVKAEAAGGYPVYVKARDIAPDVESTARCVGARMAYLGEADVPIEVDIWSETSGASTYVVEADGRRRVREYIRTLEGEPEPKLTA